MGETRLTSSQKKEIQKTPSLKNSPSTKLTAEQQARLYFARKRRRAMNHTGS